MADYNKIQERLNWIFDRNVFFIAGLTRFGTDALRQSLDAHPNICCKGEGHITDTLFPLLGRSIGQYNESLQKQKGRLNALGINCDPANFTRDELNFLTATAVGILFNHWVEDDQVMCIGEKTPENALAMDQLNQIIPQAKFIHVIRDGRDEAVSTWQCSLHLNPEAFSKTYPHLSHFVNSFVKSWCGGVGKARAFGRTAKDRYLEIRCEDLLNDPEAVFSRVLPFLGLDNGGDQVSMCAAESRQSTAYNVGIGCWRDQFDDDCTNIFMRHGGELLKLLEYDI